MLAEQNGALTLVPPQHLPLWLPDLEVPAGWIETTSEAAAPVTRMLVRRVADMGPADGCELLNLYRVPGRIAEATVLDHADRTLRDSGATDLHTWRVELAAGYGAVSMRSAGRLAENTRDVWVQYSYYAVNADAGAALIEQTIVIGYDALTTLVSEMNALTADVCHALVASLRAAPNHHDAQNPLIAAGGGRPSTWSDVESIAVQARSGLRDAAEQSATGYRDAVRGRYEPA